MGLWDLWAHPESPPLSASKKLVGGGSRLATVHSFDRFHRPLILQKASCNPAKHLASFNDALEVRPPRPGGAGVPPWKCGNGRPGSADLEAVFNSFPVENRLPPRNRPGSAVHGNPPIQRRDRPGSAVTGPPTDGLCFTLGGDRRGGCASGAVERLIGVADHAVTLAVSSAI